MKGPIELLKEFMKDGYVELSDEQLKRLDEAMRLSKEEMDALAEKLGKGMHELPDGSLLQVGPPVHEKMEISPEIRERLDKLLARVDELVPPVETVRLKLSRGATTVFDSKMGGVPYFPKDMEFPTVREGDFKGKPLRLLAQLNFGALPKLEGFPTEGILQFFVFPDDIYGADFDDPRNQNFYRIIYHENIITDAAALIDSVPEIEFDNDLGDLFPFAGEFLLTAEPLKKMTVTSDDFRGKQAILKAYGELFGADVKSIYDFMHTDPDFADEVFDNFFGRGTRMGGYPSFEQDDPRGDNNEFANHTILLFQSDSEGSGEAWDDRVCWGDMGVANFFITPEDLAKRDFSNVLYTWDCG